MLLIVGFGAVFILCGMGVANNPFDRVADRVGLSLFAIGVVAILVAVVLMLFGVDPYLWGR